MIKPGRSGYVQKVRNFLIETTPGITYYSSRRKTNLRAFNTFVQLTSSPMAIKPTLILVAGGCHTTEYLEPLKRGLLAASYPDVRLVAAVSMTLPPHVDTSKDVNAVRAVFEKAIINEGKEIVVVAHSYGGMMSSDAAEGLLRQDRAAAGEPGGITRMVFLTAFALCPGETMLTNPYVKPDPTPEEVAANYAQYEFRVLHLSLSLQIHVRS
jgi:pimeloyl-ACP methyl ester carboxylesterase